MLPVVLCMCRYPRFGCGVLGPECCVEYAPEVNEASWLSCGTGDNDAASDAAASETAGPGCDTCNARASTAGRNVALKPACGSLREAVDLAAASKLAYHATLSLTGRPGHAGVRMTVSSSEYVLLLPLLLVGHNS